MDDAGPSEASNNNLEMCVWILGFGPYLWWYFEDVIGVDIILD